MKEPKRTLNLIRTTKEVVETKWNLKLPFKYGEILYIQCNYKGDINWNSASIWRAEELVKRGNYNVLNY